MSDDTTNTYRHEITLVGYEIPDGLRKDLQAKHPLLGVPVEDRTLKVVIECDEPDPDVAKQMLLRRLQS
jgi:hypothetical protein